MSAMARREATSVVMAILALTAIACLPLGRRAAAAPNTWKQIAGGVPTSRHGGVLVSVPDAGKMLFLGGFQYPIKKKAPYIQAFDPAAAKWSAYSEARPKRGVYPLYRVAYDAKGKKVYCLSQIMASAGRYFLQEGQLYSFDLDSNTWKQYPRDPALKDMDWHTMALDTEERKLVVVGADMRPGNVGWSRTVLYDIRRGKWRPLPPPAPEVVKEHQELVAAKEALIDLIGRTRLAWYRDPAGIGAAAEITALQERSAKLGKMPGMAMFREDLKPYEKLLSGKRTLDALKYARELQQEIEAHAEAQYPVPPSRQNSPLVYDAKNKVFVLFGGDHQDYLTNDTWILDLRKGWRRAAPNKAPGPRAGHAMVYLPKSGKILLYGGYLQGNRTGYSAYRNTSYKAIVPYQMWVYDVVLNRWDLLTSWTPKRGDAESPNHFGFYYDYRAKYSPPPLAADGGDTVFLTSSTSAYCPWQKSATWQMKVDTTKCDTSGTAKAATVPNQRLYRKGMFRAAYCEVPDPPPDTKLDDLPVNKFVKLPNPPRNVCYGCRNRVWSTAVWDSNRDQILVWGGGHCVRSENPPIHYSPVSGRMVEGYDAQEAYSLAGNYGSTTLNRPWVGGHSWNLYAYDPVSKRMITDTGHHYDPERMDWLRDGPVKPLRKGGYNLFLEGTRHGVVAWGHPGKGFKNGGLWLLDLNKGWRELIKPNSTLSLPVVDHTGMVYDGKRDRMLMGVTRWHQRSDGNLTAFYFQDRRVEKLNPANADLGQIMRNREMVYVEHADWVLFGEPYAHVAGERKDITVVNVPQKEKNTKYYLRAYDCAGNRWMLLDIDGFPRGGMNSHGWLYDAKRRVVYVVNSNRWGVWALCLDPKTVKTLTERPLESTRPTSVD